MGSCGLSLTLAVSAAALDHSGLRQTFIRNQRTVCGPKAPNLHYSALFLFSLLSVFSLAYLPPNGVILTSFLSFKS